MFIKLKIRYKGKEFEISIHEAVYIAQNLINSLVPQPVLLVPQNPPNYPIATDAITSKDDFPEAMAKMIVPFTIGPLTHPLQWLFVARELPNLKPRKHVGININSHVVGIQLADLYSADFGMMQMLVHRLYYSTFAENWKNDGFFEAHDILYGIIDKEYKSGNLGALTKLFNEDLNKDLLEGLRQFYPWKTEEELLRDEKEIRSSNVTDDFFPQFLENRKIYSQNRALSFFPPKKGDQQDQDAEDGLSLQELQSGYDLLQTKIKKANEGDFELLPKAEYAFRSSLNIYDPTNPRHEGLQEVEADIAKGPSYQKIDRAQEAKLRYISDVEIAKQARSILMGVHVSDAPSYLPNLLACWFICEVGRNPSSLLSGLILLDFIENETKYFACEFGFNINLYEYQYVLRNPNVGQRGVVIPDIYGRKIGPDVWGGMHPMASVGSYEGGEELKIQKNKASKYKSDPLTIVKQKEGSLLLHWLYNTLQHYHPDIDVELVEHDPDHPISSDVHYNEVVIDIDNTTNPKLPCGLKIESTNTVALNQKIRQVKDEINKLLREKSDMKDELIQTQLETLEPLRAKLEFIETIVKPVLHKRMTSFDNSQKFDVATETKEVVLFPVVQGHQTAQNRWYSEDIINQLLHLILGENAVILPQTQIEHASLLNDNLSNAIVDAMEQHKPVVIPIHLHGNHWAPIVIKKNDENLPLQVIYNDPLGNPLEFEMRAVEVVCAITQLDPNADIIDLQLPQQSNAVDCGPFTVDNLCRLSTTSTNGLSRTQLRQLLVQPLNGSARNIRLHHHQILLQVLSEDEINELYNDDSDALPSASFSRKVPKYERKLFDLFWQIYPDQQFIEECFLRLNFFEKALVTGKITSYTKIAVDMFEMYAKAYRQQDNPPMDQITLLEQQIQIIKNGKEFYWVDESVRGIIVAYIFKYVLNKMADSSKGLPMNLHQGWVIRLLAKIKFDPQDGHKELFGAENLISDGLEKIMTIMAHKPDMVEALNKKEDEFVAWINAQLKSGGIQLKILLDQLLDLMTKLEIQESFIFAVCVKQVELLEEGSDFPIKDALDFLSGFSHLEILHRLNSKLNHLETYGKKTVVDDCSQDEGSAEQDDSEEYQSDESNNSLGSSG